MRQILLFIVILLLASCRTTRQVETHQWRTVRDSVVLRDSVVIHRETAWRDSVAIHDSVVITVSAEGKVLAREHFHNRERNRARENQTENISGRDSRVAHNDRASDSRVVTVKQSTGWPIGWLAVTLLSIVANIFLISRLWKLL